MATTVYAQRCNELKVRYTANVKSAKPSFTTQYNAMWGLLGLSRLSRTNTIWCGKRIHEMVEVWIESDQREMIDRLAERHQRAWNRWEKRIAERAQAKAAVKTRAPNRFKKYGQPTTPAAPAPDIWSLDTIDQDELKERARGQEIMRLLSVSREHGTDGLLDAAFSGREQTVESVKQLYGYVLCHFGSGSEVTPKFWTACDAFLTTAGITQTEREKIERPLPVAGDPDFRSVLEEFEP